FQHFPRGVERHQCEPFQRLCQQRHGIDNAIATFQSCPTTTTRPPLPPLLTITRNTHLNMPSLVLRGLITSHSVTSATSSRNMGSPVAHWTTDAEQVDQPDF